MELPLDVVAASVAIPVVTAAVHRPVAGSGSRMIFAALLAFVAAVTPAVASALRDGTPLDIGAGSVIGEAFLTWVTATVTYLGPGAKLRINERVLPDVGIGVAEVG